MTASLDFRAVLIKIQDLLSDKDRERLHFLLGEDIPRCLRDDSSVGGALRVLESLFEKAIISNQDCDYLIEAFMNIHCRDAAKRLKEYQKNQARKDQRTFSLQEILLEDDEEDKIAGTRLTSDVSESIMGTNSSSPFLSSTTKSKALTNSLLSTDNRKQTYTDQSRRMHSMFKRQLNIREWILITITILAIFSLPLAIILSRKSIECLSKSEQGMVKHGERHGGSSAGVFEDAIELDLSPTAYCIGIKFFYRPDHLSAIEFIYRNNASVSSKMRGELRNTNENAILNETFMMQGEERINKVTLYVGTQGWVDENGARVRFVLGIQFYTTTGRTSGLYGSNTGSGYTESYEGFTLGYAKGRCGMLVDMLQFVWYRQVK